MSADSSRDDSRVDLRKGDGDSEVEEALSWGPTPDDPSYLETPVDDDPAATTDEIDDDDDEDDELPDGVMSSTMLVVHGIFGGVYLLLTVAWLISVSRMTAPSLSGVPLAFWYLSTYIAIAAAPLWFVGTLAFTDLVPARRRIVWLAVGVLVLLPWPFLVGRVS